MHCILSYFYFPSTNLFFLYQLLLLAKEELVCNINFYFYGAYTHRVLQDTTDTGGEGNFFLLTIMIGSNLFLPQVLPQVETSVREISIYNNCTIPFFPRFIATIRVRDISKGLGRSGLRYSTSS